jgi:hypothetical protein
MKPLPLVVGMALLAHSHVASSQQPPDVSPSFRTGDYYGIRDVSVSAQNPPLREGRWMAVLGVRSANRVVIRYGFGMRGAQSIDVSSIEPVVLDDDSNEIRGALFWVDESPPNAAEAVFNRFRDSYCEVSAGGGACDWESGGTRPDIARFFQLAGAYSFSRPMYTGSVPWEPSHPPAQCQRLGQAFRCVIGSTGSMVRFSLGRRPVRDLAVSTFRELPEFDASLPTGPCLTGNEPVTSSAPHREALRNLANICQKVREVSQFYPIRGSARWQRLFWLLQGLPNPDDIFLTTTERNWIATDACRVVRSVGRDLSVLGVTLPVAPAWCSWATQAPLLGSVNWPNPGSVAISAAAQQSRLRVPYTLPLRDASFGEQVASLGLTSGDVARFLAVVPGLDSPTRPSDLSGPVYDLCQQAGMNLQGYTRSVPSALSHMTWSGSGSEVRADISRPGQLASGPSTSTCTAHPLQCDLIGGLRVSVQFRGQPSSPGEVLRGTGVSYTALEYTGTLPLTVMNRPITDWPASMNTLETDFPGLVSTVTATEERAEIVFVRGFLATVAGFLMDKSRENPACFTRATSPPELVTTLRDFDQHLVQALNGTALGVLDSRIDQARLGTTAFVTRWRECIAPSPAPAAPAPTP